MSELKDLLKGNGNTVVIGRNRITGEPFVFVRNPGDGGVLHQSFSKGLICGVYFVSEDGEIKKRMTLDGVDFKTAVRQSLSLLDPKEKPFQGIEEILAVIDHLMDTKAEEVV